jgi:hypothetical protein
MIHSFGFKDENYTGFYDGKFRFYIVNNADGRLEFIGELEGDKENYKFGRILVEDSNNDTQMQVVQKFYDLWEKFKTKGVEEKKLIKVRVAAEGIKEVSDLDAVADILVITKKFTPDAKVERPDITVKKEDKTLGSPRRNLPMLSPRSRSTTQQPIIEESSVITFQGQCITYKEDEGLELSLKNMVEAYTVNLVTALKTDGVATLALPSLETAFLAKLGKAAEELGEDNFEGKCFAQAFTAYLKETEKLRQKQQQQQHKQNDEEDDPAVGTATDKRIFQSATLIVKNEEELQRVKQGIKKQFA